VQLQRRYADIRRQGLGLVAISYDSPQTLKKFADSRGITFPMISDRDSAIIRAYGIFNDGEKPGTRSYGIPHPGTFIVDRQGRVVSRFFEDAYQERFTVAAMLPGIDSGGATVKASTAHLAVTASISDAVAAPGKRVSMVADIVPGKGIHVYAPGKHGYQVVRLVVAPQPWLKVHDAVYPRPEIYHFKPLDERVEVYTKPFRLRQDVTLLATPEVQKLLASRESVTLAATLEYQACDDKVCFNPGGIPLTFTIAVIGLDRRPAGGIY
jgi:hypothetical protein